LVGIKPTRGRVSTWPDAEAFNGITVIGPLARSVGDAALLLDAITSNDPRDIHSLPLPAEPFAAAVGRDPGKLRIALSFKIPFSGVPTKLDPAVRKQVEELAETLTALGHDVVAAEPHYGIALGACFLPRSTAGVAGWVDRVPDRSGLDHRTLDNARSGGWLGGGALKFARALEPVVSRQIGRIFRDYDVMITPTTAKPPLEADAIDGLKSYATDRAIVGSCPYAWSWNVTGWPGISVPAGFVDGLPVGAQLLGQAGSEPRLIALAAQLEAARGWTGQRPPLFS
jgi:amidase